MRIICLSCHALRSFGCCFQAKLAAESGFLDPGLRALLSRNGSPAGPQPWPLLWYLLQVGAFRFTLKMVTLWKFGPESLVVCHPLSSTLGCGSLSHCLFLEVNGLSSGALFDVGRFEAFENEACLFVTTFAGRGRWRILSFLWGVLFSEENSVGLVSSQLSLKVRGQNFQVYFFSL